MVSYWENSISDGVAKVPHLSVITILKKICNDPRLVKAMDEDHISDDESYNDSYSFGVRTIVHISIDFRFLYFSFYNFCFRSKS